MAPSVPGIPLAPHCVTTNPDKRPSPMSTRDPRVRLTVGLTIIMTVIAFEALAVATVAPRVASELGGLDLYGWTFSAFMLAGLVGTVVAGARGRPARAGPALSRRGRALHGGAARVRGGTDDAPLRRRPCDPGPRRGRGSARSRC